MIPEITIKISFAAAPEAGGAVSVLGASGGVEIAPPVLPGGEVLADMNPAPPEVGTEGAWAAVIEVPPPPSVPAMEGGVPPPPGFEDEADSHAGDEAPSALSGRGGKRVR